MSVLPATFCALLRYKRGAIGCFYVIFIVAACIIGPACLPSADAHIDLHHRFLRPFQFGHVLGTDEIGRDLLDRILKGGRVSLIVGITSTFFSAIIGTVIGIIAGYHAGMMRFIISTVIDVILCFPVIFLLLTLASVFVPGISTIISIVTLVSWMEVARVVQGQTLLVRQKDYVTAVAAMGARNRVVLFQEIFPNVLPVAIVSASLTMARAILLEAYISYLGYGIQPPDASWGNLLNNAQEYLESDPFLAIVPGLVIVLTVMMFNFLGEALRDVVECTSGGRQ